MSAWITGDYNASQALYPKLATAAGCPTTGAASLACLRGLNYSYVMQLGLDVGTDGGSPVVDGVEVIGIPHVLAAAGKIAPGVQTILGTNWVSALPVSLLTDGSSGHWSTT